MNTFNFKSSVCTSLEQSERLLALGLKKETADMVLLKEMVYDEENHCTRDGDNYLIRPIDYLEGEEHRGHIPAWSLHRLIEMLNIQIQTDGRYIYLADGGFDAHASIYDNIIDCIEGLIKEGHFNKELL